MIVFFQCVAESLAAKGFRSLAKELPFGTFLFEVAEDVYKRLKEQKQHQEIRAEIENMARVGIDEVKKAAMAVAKEAMPGDPAKEIELELYLSQIPGVVKQSLRRPSDPSGHTAPPGFTISRVEDVLALLPTRVSSFRPGDPLPNREGWTLLEMLGTGGFGEVWLAQHPNYKSLRRAVKFCKGLTDKDRALLREGDLIDRVMGAGAVPNVVSLIDADLAGETPWLMYEYCGHGDLVKVASGWAGAPPAKRHAQAISSLRQIITAVAHFHRLGVVHRDLKPANVLIGLSSLGEPKLMVADFGIGGIASQKELNMNTTSTSKGELIALAARGAYTPHYASPQQKKGFPPDPRDDIYALGVIGYQLMIADVTAERPGGKGWRRTLREQGVTPGLLDLLESCWDDKESERPKNAGELLRQLAGIVPAGEPVAAPPERPKKPEPRKERPPERPEPKRQAKPEKPGKAVQMLVLFTIVGGLLLAAIWAVSMSMIGMFGLGSPTTALNPATSKTAILDPVEDWKRTHPWLINGTDLDKTYLLGEWGAASGDWKEARFFPRSMTFLADGTIRITEAEVVYSTEQRQVAGITTTVNVPKIVLKDIPSKYSIAGMSATIGDTHMTLADQQTLSLTRGSKIMTYMKGKKPPEITGLETETPPGFLPGNPGQFPLMPPSPDKKMPAPGGFPGSGKLPLPGVPGG
ncbi:serine/threonine-protein kinase [Zavarzinella formosa]|uniref:serine/threonine-protein kinase n=1 Tax=Zavarzinella formosa TaxID=360055 RepID=UPI0002F089E0|nr:serine/threonine-protein kinase [Zavarzinella formosa]